MMMTQAPINTPQAPNGEEPRANVYTVLLLVVVVTLAFTLGWVLWHLMSAPPNGCGMELGDLFQPLKDL